MSNQPDPSKLRKDRQLRREKVRALHFQGLSAWAIARKLRVPRTTVRRDLAYFQRQYREAVPQEGNITLAEELDRQEFLKGEAWKAWERSQRPATTEKTTIEEGGERPKSKIEKTVRSQAGDWRYFEMFSQLMLGRCQSANQQPAGKNDGHTLVIEFTKLSQCRDHLGDLLERSGHVDGLADVYARAIREDCQPRALEARPTSRRVGSGDHGPGAGSPIEIDRSDAAETWEI